MAKRIPGFSEADVLQFSTRELSKETWPDFERLFESHPAPGAHPCWCMHHQLAGPAPGCKSDSRASKIEWNHQQKKALMECGAAHGILVYGARGEPVGWCQYGPKEELPRIDNHPSYRKIPLENGDKRLWRITCFVVHYNYRRRGIASTALKAALTAIKNRGGGTVEAYPIRRWGAYQAYRGTVSMFEKEGFKPIGPLGASNVLMRRSV